MISSSTGINPASAAIMEISQATFTPCENIRRVSAMISGGFIPPNLLVIPRPTPLSAWDPIKVSTPFSSSLSIISSEMSTSFGPLNPA